MSTTSFPTPQPGDVLFTSGANVASEISAALQSFLDPQARDAPSHFSHVAIAIDSSVALEAKPAPKKFSVKSATPGIAPTAKAEIAPWSGVELAFGVRLIPLPDIFIPAHKNSTPLVVLRAPSGNAPVEHAFSIISSNISGVIGSEYSLKSLEESAERLLRFEFPQKLRDLIGSSFSSDPDDLATKMKIDDALRAQITELIPTLGPEYTSRKYFCSQLVASLLETAGLVASGTISHDATPTGLHQKLLELNWVDVTESDYGPSNIDACDSRSRQSSCSAHFLETEAYISIAQQLFATGLAAQVLNAHQEKAIKSIDQTTDRLMRIIRNDD